MNSSAPRFSIITAIRDQKAVNELFLESLKRYTSLPYELIIIDNASTDGSTELFEKAGARIIRNTENYSYPVCQNQGIKAAKSDIFFFLNNDMILSRHWDTRSLEIIEKKKLEVFSWATTDRLESEVATKKIKRRWKRIKYVLTFLFKVNSKSLIWMVQLMYKNWERFTESRYTKFQDQCIENFSGSAVGMTRAAFEKIGLWDERIQGADFDLYLRVKDRQQKFKDISPMQLMLGVYIHHFQRLSFKNARFKPFADTKNIIAIEKKWNSSFIESALADLHG